MCSVAVVVLLAFVTVAYAEASMPSLESSEAADVQDKLVGRVLKSGELRGAGLDLTTIGKRHANGRQEKEELGLKHKADIEMAAKQSAPVQPEVEPKPTTMQSAAVQPTVGANESAMVARESKPEAIAKETTVVQPKVGVELVANVSAGVQPKARKEQPKAAGVHSSNVQPKAAGVHSSDVQPKAAGVQYSAKHEPTALHSADVQHKTGLELAESPSVNTDHKLKSDSAATHSTLQRKVAVQLAAKKSNGMQQVYDSYWTSCGGVIAVAMIFLLVGSGAIVAMRRFQRRHALHGSDYVMIA